MEAVTVVARFRGAESGDDDFGDWALTDTSIKHNEKHHEFNFDAVLDPLKSQAELYEAAGRKIINFFCDGYNGTIFAYGQSGSGKTFSMLGPETVTETLIDKDVEVTPDVEAMFGITPRATFHLFENIKAGQAKGNKYDVRVSYIEVYNEMINDILPCPPGQNLKIREFPNQGMCVIGMLENAANSPEAVFEGLSAGTANRMVCSTGQNARSSRSHTVFIISLEQTSIEGTVKKAKINLVDLAGSEKLSKTGAQGQALKEAKNINLSLTTLGRCIKALTAGSAEFVPYRESKLTLILKESLSGAAMTVLIVTGSMRKIHQEETIGTMQFAERAKMVKTAAKSNTKRSYDELDRLVTKLTDEVNALKKALKEGGGPIPESLSVDVPAPSEAPAGSGGSGSSGPSASSLELTELKAKYETLEESSARQIEELKHSIERAETKMGNAEFVGIKEEMDSFKDRLNEATEQIARIRQERELQTETYSHKISSHLERLRELTQELEVKLLEVKAAHAHTRALQGQLAEKDSESFRLQQEVQDAGSAETRYKAHLNELNRILAQEHEKHHEIHNEIARIKHQLAEAEACKHEAQQSLHKAESESKELTHKVAELEVKEARLAEEVLKLRDESETIRHKTSRVREKLDKLEKEAKKVKFELKSHEEEAKLERTRLEQEIRSIVSELEGLRESNKDLISEEAKQAYIASHVGQFKDQLARAQEDLASSKEYFSDLSSTAESSKAALAGVQSENNSLEEKIKEIQHKCQTLAPVLESEKEVKNKLHEELRLVEESQQKLIEAEENKVKADMQLRMQAFIDQDSELKAELFKKQEDLQNFKNQAEEEIEQVKHEIISAKKENFELEIQVKNVQHEMIQRKIKNDEELALINATVQERVEEIRKLREVIELQELKLRENQNEIQKLEANVKQKASERDTERKNSIIRATLVPKRNTIFNKAANQSSDVNRLSAGRGQDKIMTEALREAEELAKNCSVNDILKVSYEINSIKSMYGGEDHTVPTKRHVAEIIEEENEDRLD